VQVRVLAASLLLGCASPYIICPGIRLFRSLMMWSVGQRASIGSLHLDPASRLPYRLALKGAVRLPADIELNIAGFVPNVGAAVKVTRCSNSPGGAFRARESALPQRAARIRFRPAFAIFAFLHLTP
jgi:hypothetical protein